ncbi:MAG: hypothetical protein ACPGRX_01535, partial [Bdellovibrionales bacterium]
PPPPAKIAATPKMPVPVKATGSALSTIRMADYADKTRLVLEAGAKLDYTADIDNAENLMILTFSNGSLGLDPSKVKKSSKTIKTMSGTPQDHGFIIAIDLAGPASILKQGRIAPNKDNPNHRIFIDISK